MVLVSILTVGQLPDVSQAQDRRQHVVTAGETLFRISRTYGVGIDDIRRANGLVGDAIQVGQVLVIPVAPVPDAAEPPAPPPVEEPTVEEPAMDHDAETPDPGRDSIGETTPPEAATELTEPSLLAWLEAAPGQSLYDIAFAIGLGADSLAALNPALPSFLSAGDGIRVPKSPATVMHGVRQGDTLFKIAREYATTVEELRRANGMMTDVIHVGQVIIVPASRAAVAAAATLPSAGRGVVRQYPSRFAGRLMAGGREYEPEAYTISHADLPIGSLVLLTTDEGHEVFAEVADRLPSSADYLVDVSKAVAEALGLSGSNPEAELYVVRFGSTKR